MSSDLQVTAARLAELAKTSPTAGERREVEEAAKSKWEGTQVAAARTLCAWGDSQSLRSVRELLERLAQDRSRHASISAVAKALSPNLKLSDLDWVLELCFKTANPHNRTWLMELFTGTPPGPTLKALESRVDARGYNAKEVRSAIAAVRSVHIATHPNKSLERTRDR
jgi:hypothetical protein